MPAFTMHAARSFAAPLLAALAAACAPVPLVPNALLEAPQGATFFAEAVQDLPLVPAPLPALPVAAPSPLDGAALCGSDPGERARAQCLRGEGWDTAPPAAWH